jgi:hypothetical protein
MEQNRPRTKFAERIETKIAENVETKEFEPGVPRPPDEDGDENPEEESEDAQ